MAVDPVQELITLISAAWTSSNTDSKTPIFKKVWDQKRLSIRLGTNNNNSIITFYDTTNVMRLSGQGGASADSFRHVSNIKVDIRAAGSESFAYKLLYEVYRILQVNTTTGTTNFAKIIPDFNYTNLSDKTRNIWRYVIDVQLKTERRSL